MSPSRRSAWSLDDRLCLLVFGLAFALNVGLSSIGWTHTVLGPNEFRQAQTAVTVDSFLRHGITLDYSTPLLGPPWQIPLEFPLYQAAVAGFVRLTGMDLDAAGRLVSWLFFVSALPACYLLLGRLRVHPPHRLLFLALLVLSPLYIYHTRSFLIESAVLSLSCWFLVGFDRWLYRGSQGGFALAAVCGALAGAVKGTTLAIFLVAALLLLFAALRDPGTGRRGRLWWRAFFGVLLPLAGTLAWTYHASAVRRLNPDAAFMDDIFGYWSFGDVAQRVSPGFWLRTFRFWADSIVGEAGIALIVLYYAWLRGRHRWAVTGCIAVFLSGQLIFSNLFWTHDYYFYANGLFLVAAVGFFLVELVELPALPRAARWVVVLAALGLEVSAYHRTYFDRQSTNIPVPEAVALLRSITGPDEPVVIIGHDWDGSYPYYAHRNALMILRGRELDRPGVRRSVQRLGTKVGAVMIHGAYWGDADYLAQTMPELHLGPRPFLYDEANDLAFWVPLARQPALRDAFDPARHPGFRIAVEDNAGSQPVTLYARQIRRRSEFADFRPRPTQATPFNYFSDSIVDGIRVLNTHAPCELVFHAPAGAHRLTAVYGIAEAAYTGNGHTDGVEFAITERQPDGSERTLFRRLLNPVAIVGDRGLQKLELPLPATPRGDLLIRSLPGPQNSNSFDWAYWGRVEIR